MTCEIAPLSSHLLSDLRLHIITLQPPGAQSYAHWITISLATQTQRIIAIPSTHVFSPSGSHPTPSSPVPFHTLSAPFPSSSVTCSLFFSCAHFPQLGFSKEVRAQCFPFGAGCARGCGHRPPGRCRPPPLGPPSPVPDHHGDGYKFSCTRLPRSPRPAFAVK